jgi:hypothetical protein
MFMPFSCGTKDTDYSVSGSPQPDIKTVSISLHSSHTWAKIRVHVNLTSPHPGPGAEVSTEISPKM